jgi:hypothetical protein
VPELQAQPQDIAQFEEQSTPVMVNPADEGQQGPKQVAAHDPATEIETVIESSQADLRITSNERMLPEQGGLQPDLTATERESASGEVSQLELTASPEEASIASTATEQPTAVAIPDADPSMEVELQTAPLSGRDPLESVGIEIVKSPQRTMPARSLESRLPRPERSLPERSQVSQPVRESASTPMTPIPLAATYDEVRIGQATPMASEALRSAAALVDINQHSIRRRESVAATYQLRDLELRREAARRFGGTAESEAAVERSLRWLAGVQSRDGHWDAATFGAGKVQTDENGVPRNFAGRDADTGVTALTILSFLGAGYTHESGRYAVPVDHALHWLISVQGEDGNLCGDAGHYARMYCHAMATYALAESYGMQKDHVLGPIVDPAALSAAPSCAIAIGASMLAGCGVPVDVTVVAGQTISDTSTDLVAYGMRRVDDLALRSALLKAITFTLSQQDPDSGGWRYKFGQEGDVSMFGWQMMSLKSAEIAGVRIDPRVRDRMVSFLNSVRQGDSGGLFSYRRTEAVTPVMTAEALFCQQMLGYPRDSASSHESVRYLLDNMPRLSQLNLYYWYYGTLAMYQYGGTPWERWNESVRDTLISQQRTDGAYAGSWDPNGPWGRYGGRLYSTAIATLTLEVYYRLLPLYRMNESASQGGNEQ